MRLGFVLLIALQAIYAAERCDQEGCSSCEMPRYLPLRDCPKFGFDCGTAQDSAFKVTTSPSTGCARLSCADPRARLFVDGRAHAMLRYRDWRWQFGRRACDRASHALCAKPCTYCSSEVPSFLPAGKFNKPMITSASATRQCAIASCVAASFLYGVASRGAVIDRILEDELACTGEARWRDSSMTTQSAEERHMGMDDGEIGDLTCSFDSKWRINGIQVDDAMEIACVKSQNACSRKLDAPLSKFQSPGFTSSYKYQDEPLHALPCPDGTFYYLENEGNQAYDDVLSGRPATCDERTGKWKVNDEYYYQIACAKRNCKECVQLSDAIEGDFSSWFSGFIFKEAATKNEASCHSYSCARPQELAIIDEEAGPRMVKSLKCGRDGTWLINGVPPAYQPKKVACLTDCSACNKAVMDNTLLPPDFAMKSGTPCIVALKCPKGKFFVQTYPNGPYNELSTGSGNEAVCECGWRMDTKRGADCTGNCQVSQFLGDITDSPGFYRPTDVEKFEVERYDELFQKQSCVAYECPSSPFSLVLKTSNNVPFIAKRLKCEGNDLWFDNQDPSPKILYADCMERDDNCKRNFPVEGANYSAAIIEMNVGFHLAVYDCPGSLKYYYLKDKWATPTETTDKPLCKDGLWKVGSVYAEFIGCKAGCPALKTLACPSGMVCFPEDVTFANDILQCVHGQLLMSETENGPVKEEHNNRCLPADDPESMLREWSKRDSYYTCAFEYSDACIQASMRNYGIPIKVKATVFIFDTSAQTKSRSTILGLRTGRSEGILGSTANSNQQRTQINIELKFTPRLTCIRA